jgi:hypothetical protein
VRQSGLETNAGVLQAGIRDGHEPDMLVTGADVGHDDTKLFQTRFQWFDGKFLVRHELAPF